MFLSSDPIVPFDTTDEGLSRYPDWKLVTYPGIDILIRPKGKKHYVKKFELGVGGIDSSKYVSKVSVLLS